MCADACQTCETLLHPACSGIRDGKKMAPDAADERRQGTGWTTVTPDTDGDGEADFHAQVNFGSRVHALYVCVLIPDVD